MRKLCLWWVILTFWCPPVWGESTWLTRFTDPAGEIRQSYWEIRKTGADSIGYFLQGKSESVYTLRLMPEETQVVLANGVVRRFSPGFLLLTDLPLPIFLPVGGDFESGRHCFQEYVGETGFQSCVKITLVDSLGQASSLPVPQSGEVILVIREKRLEAIVGPDFEAQRKE